MKFLVKVFLTIVILLSGFGQLAAHAHDYYTAISQENNLEKFQNAEFNDIYNALTPIINYSSCHVEKLNDKTYTSDTENEENELASKKWLVTNDYFTGLSSQAKFLNHDIKKGLPQSRFITPLPSCKRYIMFRVFRI